MNKRTYISLFIGAALFLCCMTAAYAGPPVRAIHEAQAKMTAGAPAEALAMLQEALVDYPDSAELRFGIGCAWFMVGEQHLPTGALDEAAKAFAEGRSVFEGLMTHDNPVIAREATFNRANCLAKTAETIDPQAAFNEAVEALRVAAAAYEQGLKQYPNHEDMRGNRDRVRFLLKRLLQNKPEQQEQQDNQPQDTPPPKLFSLFGRATTQLPGADARVEEDIAILTLPGKQEAQP